MICKHCGGEVREIDEGLHFTAVHVVEAGCKYVKLGENDVKEAVSKLKEDVP